jgi:membrane-associated protein
MDMKFILDMFLHLDKTLGEAIVRFDTGIYLILFLIIFAETGLVVTPFLPGDSLLFAAGIFAAKGQMSLALLLLLLCAAAILGDTVNYAIGKYLGPKIFRGEKSRFLKREHLDKTHQFYEKYGAKTIILARFVPIVRTFAPFVAGIGSMTYGKFLTYNVVGALLWVGICVFAGYYFGQISFVKNNFSVVVLAIVLVSVLPIAIEFLKHRAQSKAQPPAEAEPEATGV